MILSDGLNWGSLFSASFSVMAGQEFLSITAAASSKLMTEGKLIPNGFDNVQHLFVSAS